MTGTYVLLYIDVKGYEVEQKVYPDSYAGMILTDANLIDEYKFLVHPIIMGNGKRFFKDGIVPTRLRLIKTKTLDLGVVLLCYEPAKN